MYYSPLAVEDLSLISSSMIWYAHAYLSTGKHIPSLANTQNLGMGHVVADSVVMANVYY
jgi:hypothetical protein